MTLSYTLVMQRNLIAHALFNKLRKATEARLYCENDYMRAECIIRANKVNVALIEVAEFGEYDIAFCLALCARLRSTECKLVLLCPEQNEQVVAITADAMKRGAIDDFVYYDSSLDYVVVKLLSISMLGNLHLSQTVGVIMLS